MKPGVKHLRFVAVALLAVCSVVMAPGRAQAQVRGQYTPGMNATNSGTLPGPGLTFINYFQLYSFDQLKGPGGRLLPVKGSVSVIADQNIFLWTSKKKILGGTFAVLADLPITQNSLTSVSHGALAGGAGLADSYYQPATLGWNLKRADVQAGYGFTAPTGRFTGGASNNVGSGYWGNDLFAAQTVYLTKNKATAVSAYQMYEVHTTQRDTDIHPGQTFDIDYALTQVLPLKKDESLLLQVGLVGYGQYQTTDHSGPGVNASVASTTHYSVHALGVAANIILPARKASLGFKYFNELSNNSTVEGYSLQIYSAVTF